MGQQVTPLQIRAEWLEYKLIFDDLLGRMGTQLARQAKAERKRLQRQLELEEAPGPDSRPVALAGGRKAQLRRMVAEGRGVPTKPARPPGPPPPPAFPEDEELSA